MLSKSEAASGPRSPRQTLIETNILWLNQALDLLDRIDEEAFLRTPRGLEPHRAGAHLRHILEFYDCFLDGLDSFRLDYDARRRDASLERSRAAAARRIAAIVERLNDLRFRGDDLIVMVRIEDADRLGIANGWLPSSISRELQTLSSHTIHHFALISMTLRALGIVVDPRFGMAPSTLSHEARNCHLAGAA
jgi:hypothetical protein